MSILTWIEDKKRLKVLNAPKHSSGSTDSSKGLWTRCDKCGVILYIKHLKENQRVCFSCSYHLQMMSGERIENLLDKSSANDLSFLNENTAFTGNTNRREHEKSDYEGETIAPRSQTPLGGRTSMRSSKSTRSGDFCSAKKESSFRISPSVNHFTQQNQETNTRFRKPGSLEPREGSAQASVAKELPRRGTTSSPKKKANATHFSTWRPLDETVSPCDPLKFHDQKAYTDRLQDAQERTGLQDAIQTGTGMIDGIPVALAVMDFSFMGGSMGSVVGEKITRLIEYATAEGLTLLIVSASGGARMQEGVFSLMQMAKISSALQIYQSCAKLLYISILTSPTTGGVTASFAMLGDIIFAEPKALIAFAGRRVIEQTLCEDLPDDFQTSEYMLHHGLVDLIVPRRFLRQALSETIRLYQNAPFKKRGQIPFGVQNPITFLTEEKIRRNWGGLTSPGTKSMSYKQHTLFSKKELERSSLTKNSKNSSEKIDFFKANRGSKEPGPVVSSFSDQGSEELSFSCAYKSKKALRFSPSVHSRKPEDKQIYRDILTSFEIMLALFVSGNSKKQDQASLPGEETTHTKSSRDFLSSTIKAPFWVYNNLVIPTTKTFTNNKNFFSKAHTNKASSFAEQREPDQKQTIFGQYKKNQPLYCLLKNQFPDYRNIKQSKANSCPKSNICKGIEKANFGFKKLGFSCAYRSYKFSRALRYPSWQCTYMHQKCKAKRERKGVLQSKGIAPKVHDFVPYKARKGGRAHMSPYARNSLLRAQIAFEASPYRFSFCKNTSEPWSFAKQLRGAFIKRSFFNFSRKNCKVLLSKTLLNSIKLASPHKSLQKNCFGVSNLNTNLYKSSIKSPAKSYIRLKRSFVQRVIFDFGFYCSSGTEWLENIDEKHIFAEDQPKNEFLNKPYLNDGQKNLEVLVKDRTNKSLEKNREQNRAGINKETPSSSLLSRFRNLAQATLEASTLQSSYLQRSLAETPAEQKQTFYERQSMGIGLANTVFNRSAIGIQHTDYLRLRALSFLQNKGNPDNGLEKEQNSIVNENGVSKEPRFFQFCFGNKSKQAHTNLREPLQIFDLYPISGDLHLCKRAVRAHKQSADFERSKASNFDAFAQTEASPPQKERLFWSPSGKATCSYKSKSGMGSIRKKADRASKKVSVTDFTSTEADLDFLNQAIELAATESVEWRAFYIDQQLSEDLGFFDDLYEPKYPSGVYEGNSGNGTQDQLSIGTSLKPVSYRFPSQSSDSRHQLGNVLYYKILCRSKNLFSI